MNGHGYGQDQGRGYDPEGGHPPGGGHGGNGGQGNPRTMDAECSGGRDIPRRDDGELVFDYGRQIEPERAYAGIVDYTEGGATQKGNPKIVIKVNIYPTQDGTMPEGGVRTNIDVVLKYTPSVEAMIRALIPERLGEFLAGEKRGLKGIDLDAMMGREVGVWPTWDGKRQRMDFALLPAQGFGPENDEAILRDYRGQGGGHQGGGQPGGGYGGYGGHGGQSHPATGGYQGGQGGQGYHQPRGR